MTTNKSCQVKDCNDEAEWEPCGTYADLGIDLCGNHCIAHANFIGSKTGTDKEWIKLNIGPELSICPNCSEEKKLGEDYLCPECREEIATKWYISFPAIEKHGVKKNELEKLITLLIEQEIAFEVSPETS